MDADGSNRCRLAPTRALNERYTSWLPSGTRSAYQRGKQFQNAQFSTVMQANADGSCQRPEHRDPASRLRISVGEPPATRAESVYR